MYDHLGDEQWRQFQNKGYLGLGRVVSGDELHILQQRIDQIMMGRAEIDYSRLMMQLDSETGICDDLSPQLKGVKGGTLNYRKITGLEFDPVYLSYMRKPLFRHICDRAYGRGSQITCYRAMLMNKPAKKGTPLPWHQDVYDFLDPQPQVTVWLALDDATVARGCVQVLPGSHAQVICQNPSAEQIKELLSTFDPTPLECPAGEALLLHNWIVHGSDINRTDVPRRAFSVCYMNAATRCSKDIGFSRIFGAEALR